MCVLLLIVSGVVCLFVCCLVRFLHGKAVRCSCRRRVVDACFSVVVGVYVWLVVNKASRENPSSPSVQDHELTCGLARLLSLRSCSSASGVGNKSVVSHVVMNSLAIRNEVSVIVMPNATLHNLLL